MVSKRKMFYLVLFGFTVVLAQQNVFAQEQKLSTKYLAEIKNNYDKYEKTSRYEMNLSSEIMNNGLRVKVIAFHKGKKFPANSNTILYMLYFINSSDNGWQYLEYRPLKFLIDKKITDFGEIGHSGDVGNGYVLEIMHIKTKRAFINSLAFAKKAEFKLGLTEVTFSTIMKEKLQSFLYFLNLLQK